MRCSHSSWLTGLAVSIGKEDRGGVRFTTIFSDPLNGARLMLAIALACSARALRFFPCLTGRAFCGRRNHVAAGAGPTL